MQMEFRTGVSFSYVMYYSSFHMYDNHKGQEVFSYLSFRPITLMHACL